MAEQQTGLLSQSFGYKFGGCLAGDPFEDSVEVVDVDQQRFGEIRRITHPDGRQPGAGKRSLQSEGPGPLRKLIGQQFMEEVIDP
jgi:hypothetical protein